jgi:hypothetical protein
MWKPAELHGATPEKLFALPVASPSSGGHFRFSQCEAMASKKAESGVILTALSAIEKRQRCRHLWGKASIGIE